MAGTRQGHGLPPSSIVPDLDIALIETAAAADRDAVVLHRVLDSGDYLLGGYPHENFYTDLKPGAELSPPGTLKGTPRFDNETTQPTLLRLSGYQIRPGHSGGPVLNAATGAVVAVTVYSEDPDNDVGGGALPIERALTAYPQLAALADEPPSLAVRRYRDVMGQARWEALGLVWSPDEQVDIYLTGKRSCWRIGLRENDAGDELTARDLAATWPRCSYSGRASSGSRDESEVLLLGRLLSAALFPDPVKDRLPPQANANSDPVLIRLHVDPSGPLADLPWELATDPADPNRKRFLAATDGYAFVRVNPGAPVPAEPPDPRTLADQMSVLRIVVQPEEHTRWPQVVDAGIPVSWPATSQIDSDLATRISTPEGVDGNPLFVSQNPLLNPTLSDLADRVSLGGVDIVHYVGFGYQEPEDGMRSGLERSWLACSAGEGSDDLRFHRAHDVLQQIADFRAQLVIMEFGTPSPNHTYALMGDQRCQPVGPALLAAADTLDVGAMVCTRPLHPIQFDRFNRRLYTFLGAGRTVEEAVQLARRAVLMDAPVDSAGFGWFVVTTGNRLRRRYFERPGSSGAPDAPRVASGVQR